MRKAAPSKTVKAAKKAAIAKSGKAQASTSAGRKIADAAVVARRGAEYAAGATAPVEKGALGGGVRAKRTTRPSPGTSWQPEQRTRFVTEVAGGTRRAADLLDVAASQPSRWMTGESIPGPEHARMLVDLDHVLAHALLVWADARVARDWLTTANAHLDGLRPVAWMQLYGSGGVVEALRAEAAGAYA